MKNEYMYTIYSHSSPWMEEQMPFNSWQSDSGAHSATPKEEQMAKKVLMIILHWWCFITTAVAAVAIYSLHTAADLSHLIVNHHGFDLICHH